MAPRVITVPLKAYTFEITRRGREYTLLRPDGTPYKTVSTIQEARDKTGFNNWCLYMHALQGTL